MSTLGDSSGAAMRRLHCDAFVGRLPMLESLGRSSWRRPWIELVAPPGFGKTRLARHAFRRGSLLGAAELHHERVAAQLDAALPERNKRERRRPLVVIDALDERPALLDAIERWRAARNAIVVSTVRAPLAAAAGLLVHAVRVPPLAIPSAHEPLRVAARRAALQLLMRMTAREHSEPLRLLARQSDGIPVVLELLAAQLLVTPAKQLARNQLAAIAPALAQRWRPYLSSLAAPRVLDVLASLPPGPAPRAFVEQLLLPTERGMLANLVDADVVEALQHDGEPAALRLRRPFREAWLCGRSVPRALRTKVSRRYGARTHEVAARALGPELLGPTGRERGALLMHAPAMGAFLRSRRQPAQRDVVAIARASLVMAGAPVGDTIMKALARAIVEGTEAIQARARIARAIVCWFAGDTRRALGDLDHAAEGTATPALEAMATLFAARMIGEQGRLDEAQARWRSIPAPLPYAPHEARRHGCWARLCDLAGDTEAAIDSYLAQRRAALRGGDIWQVAMADISRARCMDFRDPQQTARALELHGRGVERIAGIDPHYGYMYGGMLAALYLELGSAARAERAFRRLRQPPHPSPRFDVLFACYRCAALTELGEHARAAELLAFAEAHLRQLEDPTVAGCIEHARRILEGEPICIEADPPDAARPLVQVSRRLGSAATPEPRVARDGAWFITKMGTRVELAGRPALRRVVQRLAQAGGHAVGHETLIDFAWPGDDNAAEVRYQRLRTTISQLRTLGLDAIQTRERAYAIAADMLAAPVARGVAVAL